jgi:signal recognition particle receptor subunit beta
VEPVNPVQIDFRASEVAIKLVYDGPALSGKTSNLRALHDRVSDAHRSSLLTLDTRDDRTLFFDLLPLAVRVNRVSLRIKVYTVPGQVIHNATRRLVLQGVDGVAFVADSRHAATEANAASFMSLKQNLRDAGRELKSLPLVLQFNKRDLPAIRADAELEALARKGTEPVFRAIAVRGEGVVETFVALLGSVLRRLDREGELSKTFGMGAPELLRAVVGPLGLPLDPGSARLGGVSP